MTMMFRVIARAGSAKTNGAVASQPPAPPYAARARARKWIAKSTASPSVSELSTATGMS